MNPTIELELTATTTSPPETVPPEMTTAENSDKTMKMAIATALLRTKLHHQPQSSSSFSDSLRWKLKAKQRKQEILRLTQELKEAEEVTKSDLYPESAICKCFFFNDKENRRSKQFSDCSGLADDRLTDVLRRRFIRQVRVQERKKRRANDRTGERAFEDFHREEEIEQLKLSANFLADLYDTPCPVKKRHFANWMHQAVDFIIDSLNQVLQMEKNLDLIEGIVNSLIMHLVKRMCTPHGDELCDHETDTQAYIQQIVRKLGSVSYVGQRVLLFVSHKISELADKLLVLDPFDESFSLIHDSMFVMIQLIEFLVSDNLVSWSKAEGFEITLFKEWLSSFLHARQALQVMEKRSGLYAFYMDRVTAELATQVGQISSFQNLNQDILDHLFC